MIHVPAGYAYNLARSHINWMYETEPEHGADGRRIAWPRGKVLGGSSAINGLINIRGQSADYDHWRQLGNMGWAWDDVLPYFCSLEHFYGGQSESRGRSGPLKVSPVERHEVSDAFLRALNGLGLSRRDLNAGEHEGYDYVEAITHDGLRQSSAVAFLNPVKGRPNLHIETSALVERVQFEGRRAVGVQYQRGGRERTAHCRREIILSAGAVNSPQLLELSGIGRPDIVRRQGIELVHASNEVGENLQDHYATFCSYRVVKPVTINDVSHGLPFLGEIAKYLLSRQGLLTLAPAHVLAFVKTRPELATPDLQIGILPATRNPETNSLESEPGMTCASVQLRPESRGSIHIVSRDHRVHPKIIANYLSTELDRITVVAGLRICREICAQPALSRYKGKELLPGAARHTDQELLQYAQAAGSTVYHPTSTCRMGADPTAVVDPRLRVNGVSGLRVVDASIMPTLISGNTNTPTMMIAEKAAAMILADSKIAA
jgi:choline dehydrogenase